MASLPPQTTLLFATLRLHHSNIRHLQEKTRAQIKQLQDEFRKIQQIVLHHPAFQHIVNAHTANHPTDINLTTIAHCLQGTNSNASAFNTNDIAKSSSSGNLHMSTLQDPAPDLNNDIFASTDLNPQDTLALTLHSGLMLPSDLDPERITGHTLRPATKHSRSSGSTALPAPTIHPSPMPPPEPDPRKLGHLHHRQAFLT